MNHSAPTNLSSLADKWPSSIVSRSQIATFTGGLFSPKTMANLDSLGRGPEGRFQVGRKVAYTVKSVIAWMEAKSVVV